METYNGWTNFNTWMANNHFGESDPEFIQELYEDNNKDKNKTYDSIIDYIKENVEYELSELNDGFYKLIIKNFIKDINYKEIAENMFEELIVTSNYSIRRLKKKANYKGFSNYETWAANRSFGSAIFDKMEIREIIKQNDLEQSSAEEQKNFLITYIADNIEARLEEDTPEFSPFFQDIISNVQINFREISEYCLKNIKLEDVSDDKNEIKNIKDIYDLDDNIGETNKVDFKIDVYNRDKAFIFINGEIAYSKSKGSHQQIINQWLSDNGYKETDSKWFRQGLEGHEELDESNLGFGHIEDNIAFIEESSPSGVQPIASALQNEGFEKIYTIATDAYTITRLAKLKNKKIYKFIKKIAI